jgi:A/G-specific adenine glycosylase
MFPLAKKLLRWYARHARDLPWRGSTDPYAVWVSEIMLQQTRVEAVLPYFERWMKRFPSLPDLAAASEQEVLSLWEGLGYYSRARSLHRAARIVLEQFGGELPRSVTSLRKLPGIGRYTAAAIASIAFGLDAAALDGNIRRVLARLFDVDTPADTPAGEKMLWSLAEENLPHGRAGDFNQALMDLGASICLPKNPRCLLCPLAEFCRARELAIQEQRPVLKPRVEVPHYTVTAAVIQRQGKILLAQRPRDGLLGGLWEFPGGKTEPGESLAGCLRREIREELAAGIRVGEPFGVYRHAYTHFRITLHAFLCDLSAGEARPIQVAAVAWVSAPELADYPMGKVDRQIARKIVEMGIK